MRGIYKNQLRVYLVMAVIAIIGVWSGLNLPVSLFPNSTKPSVYINVDYGDLSASEFLEKYGKNFEAQLEGITNSGNEVEDIYAEYSANHVNYTVNFGWNVGYDAAKKEVDTVANNLKSILPQEQADSLSVNQWNPNTGFLAVSFYSDKRPLTEVHKTLEPILIPKIEATSEVEGAGLYNPEQKEILVELRPMDLARMNLKARTVKASIRAALSSYSGASIKGESSELLFEVPATLAKVEEISALRLDLSDGTSIALDQIANVTHQVNGERKRVFKTNGAPSLILFANPKGGGNVKKMCEDIIEIVKEQAASTFPEDIKYRVLVDPSHFIRNAINNVFKEIFLAAGLATFILFLFLGNVKNVLTAAIEIPLSIILAFILMKITGMNLNLISLGGLALAAGMNVDASVVVLENIMRAMERKAKSGDSLEALAFFERLSIISGAVKEVLLPVSISTLTTLIVFIPLAFTSDLTNAILGDLAKAVIFSHALSLSVALILAPTIRAHLFKKPQQTKAPIDKQFRFFQNKYIALLETLIASKKIRWSVFATLAIIIPTVLVAVYQNLPKEVIGKPDSDWMIVSVNSPSTQHFSQMEEIAAQKEDAILTKHGELIKYTFVQIRSKTNATIMLRLKNKHDMEGFWKVLEKEFTNSPDTFYWVGPWNPAELPLPDPPHMDIAVLEKDPAKAQTLAAQLENYILDQKVFKRTWTRPRISRKEAFVFSPYESQWRLMAKSGVDLGISDILDITFLSQGSSELGMLLIDGEDIPLRMSFAQSAFSNADNITAYPVKIKDSLVPLKALGKFERKTASPAIYRHNREEVVLIQAKLDHDSKLDPQETYAKHQELIKNDPKFAPLLGKIKFQDAQKELSGALEQLTGAIGISFLLIFLILVIQFNAFMPAFVVVLAIPLGLLGVGLSLFLFDSNISLNSALGVILLNGVAVNNSILLVEFSNRIFKETLCARTAVLEAASKRVRPILITSLTTILGMFPIALGLGEGGKILQPLGIAVSGGLGVSTLLTLIIIPVTQYLVLNRNATRSMELPVLENVDLTDTTNTPEKSEDPTETVWQ